MGLVVRKPVFGVSDKASFKLVSTAIETSLKIEISLVASLDKIILDKRPTKALISLRGCTGGSAPVVFVNPRRHVFSRRGPYFGVTGYNIVSLSLESILSKHSVQPLIKCCNMWYFIWILTVYYYTMRRNVMIRMKNKNPVL